MSVSLNIIFNHPYVENVEVLEAIYRPRFEKIKYLIPFIKSDNPDILTVYRGSYNYHGYIADRAMEIKQSDITHYVFIQDDLLLSPLVNARNIIKKLNLSANEGYVSWLLPLHQQLHRFWNRRLFLKLNYPMDRICGSGAENFLSFLPNPEEAKEILRKYNVNISSFKTNFLIVLIEFIKNPSILKLYADTRFIREKDKSLKYPLIWSGSRSDFFIVPGKSFENFAHILGILAGGEIFAEASIGTALSLSSNIVKTEKDCDILADWSWEKKHLDLSDESNLKYLEEMFYKYGNFLLHPIKLSRLMKNKKSLKIFTDSIYKYIEE